MARYIDADKAAEMIKKDCLQQVIYTKDDAIDCIKCVPIADVQEVRHGKWVYHYRLKKFVCLECGYETKHKPDFNYCPNCGARMDKE